MLSDGEILGRVDHTLLKAAASWDEIKILCDEAVRYKTASVCIPPSFVYPVHDAYGTDPVIATVTGFPLGYSVTAVKALETEEALKSGASEIDMVINLGDVKNGRFEKVLEEVRLIKQVCGARILKVIIETCYLTQDEKIRLCQIVTEAGADYIKTSTGLGSAGATLEDVRLFKEHIGPNVKIKAAGGIKTRAEMEAFILAGVDRLGMSSAVKLLAGA